MGNVIMGNLIPSSNSPIIRDKTLSSTSDLINIINKQNLLIPKLNDAINNSQKMLNVTDTQSRKTTQSATTPPAAIPPIPQTNSPFNNINNIKNVSENFSDINYYPKSDTPIFKDYINAYNTSLALIDDPNQLNKVKFDTYIHMQNKKIAELEDNINTFPTNGNNIIKPIKAIKNFKTSTSLNVEEYRTPQTTNITSNTNNTNITSNTINTINSNPGNGSTVYPNYLIYGNNGCLEYNKSTLNPITNVKDPSTWAFKACNSNDTKQRFTMNKINNINDYNNKITDIKNIDYKIQDEKSTIMGFYVVNPETNSEQCMMLNNDGLSVMPCNMSDEQRFKPFYHSITQ